MWPFRKRKDPFKVQEVVRDSERVIRDADEDLERSKAERDVVRKQHAEQTDRLHFLEAQLRLQGHRL